MACCSSLPQRPIAVATAPGARAATASPRSPWARASCTSVPVISDRSSEIPPSSSGTPRIGSPISRPALSRSSGARQVSLASAAAGRTISAANSVTTSTSICWSSDGVRSKTPGSCAAGSRVPPPSDPVRANARPVAPIVRNPALVTRNTVCSVLLRMPRRSTRSVCASLVRAATISPIGSRRSLLARPFLPPGASAFFAASMKDMPANVTLSYTLRHTRPACRRSRRPSFS